jgi:hypothetical protein
VESGKKTEATDTKHVHRRESRTPDVSSDKKERKIKKK